MFRGNSNQASPFLLRFLRSPPFAGDVLAWAIGREMAVAGFFSF